MLSPSMPQQRMLAAPPSQESSPSPRNADVYDDTKLLASLGYQQQFHRVLGFVENWSSSFATMGFVSGVPALYGFAMNYGGPRTMVTNWLVVGALGTVTSLVMAEICSAMPIAGGVYSWTARLGGPRYGPFLSWMTAIWSFAGWTASIVSVAQGTTLFIVSIVQVYYPDVDLVSPGRLWAQFLMTLGIVVLGVLLNVVSEGALKWTLRAASITFFVQFWLYIIYMPIATSHRNSNDQVFNTWINNSGLQDKDGLVWLIGLLYPAYVFYGYDASAHLSEETVHASKRAARGMWSSTLSSYLLSIPQLFIMLYATPSFVDVAESTFAQGVTTMWVQSQGTAGATVLLVFQIVTGVFTVAANTMSASRVCFAISRDNVLPFSRLWRQTTSRGMPLNAAALVGGLSAALGTTISGSPIAYNALASIGTIATTTSYMFPILARITVSRNAFVRGWFHLGRWTEVLGWTAVTFIAFEFVILVLPTSYPTASDLSNFNFSVIMIVGLTLLSIISWLFSARKWFAPMTISHSAPNVGCGDIEGRTSVHHTTQNDSEGSRAELSTLTATPKNADNIPTT